MSDSQQVTDAQVDWSSDEAVVRAAVPSARLVSHRISNSTTGYEVRKGGGKSGQRWGHMSYDPDLAWNQVRNMPTVAAYEAQHRPKAVGIRIPEGITIIPLTPDPSAHREGGDKRVCADCGFPVDRFGAHDRSVEGFGRIDAEARPCWNNARPVAKPVPPASGFEEMIEQVARNFMTQPAKLWTGERISEMLHDLVRESRATSPRTRPRL